MSGRRQQDKFTPPPKFSMRICKRCKCDFQLGASLEQYEMKSGIIQTLCHSCALTLWSEIKRQE